MLSEDHYMFMSIPLHFGFRYSRRKREENTRGIRCDPFWSDDTTYGPAGHMSGGRCVNFQSPITSWSPFFKDENTLLKEYKEILEYKEDLLKHREEHKYDHLEILGKTQEGKKQLKNEIDETIEKDKKKIADLKYRIEGLLNDTDEVLIISDLSKMNKQCNCIVGDTDLEGSDRKYRRTMIDIDEYFKCLEEDPKKAHKMFSSPEIVCHCEIPKERIAKVVSGNLARKTHKKCIKKSNGDPFTEEYMECIVNEFDL